MGSAIDLFVAYRFIRILTTPFEKSDAFKFGIIDNKGNRLKKGFRCQEESFTAEEKSKPMLL